MGVGVDEARQRQHAPAVEACDVFAWELRLGPLAAVQRPAGHDLGDAVISSPALAGKMLVVGCEDQRVYGFRAK